MPTLGTMTRQPTSDSGSPASSADHIRARESYHARTSSENPLAKSFLRLSKSPRKPRSPLNWAQSHATVPMPDKQDDDDLRTRKLKPTALAAAIKDSNSPLTSLHDSFVPNLSTSWRGKSQRNRSISVKTALDDEDDRPITPGGILDGYLTTPSQTTPVRSYGHLRAGGVSEGQLQAQQAAEPRGIIPG